MSDDYLTCEHCGKQAADDWELEVYHRGCRFRAAFPDAVKSKGGGLIAFDVAKIRDTLRGAQREGDAGD